MAWILVTSRISLTSWSLQCGTFVPSRQVLSSLRSLEKTCCSLRKMSLSQGAWEFAFPVKSPGETAVGKELDHLKFKIL